MSDHNNPTRPTTTPQNDDRNLWFRWIGRGIVGAILAVVALGMFLYLGRTSQAPHTETRGPGPSGPIDVEVVTLESQTVPVTPKFLGQTEASQVVEVRSRVKGFLLERAFKEGQRIEKGQVLFRIDPRPFEVDRASASAVLASAEARLAQARLQLNRYEKLFARGSVASTELEGWQTAERVASAQVAQETARIARIDLDLGYTTMTAPFDGFIGRALKDVGSYVDDADNGLLAVLGQADPMYARFAVSEQETLRWKQLQTETRVTIPELESIELEITLADGSIHPHRGRINFVDVHVDPSTGTRIVRGTVPNPENMLSSGQLVHVTVLGLQYVHATLIPQRAVLQGPAGSTVYVVNDKGLAEQRAVTLSEWMGDSVVVEAGLRPGDRLVVDRLLQLRPGTPVTIRPPTPAGPSPSDDTAKSPKGSAEKVGE